MIEVQREIMQKAIKLLRAANCQFKIICPTGEEFGELDVAKKKKTSRTPDLVYGERSSMIRGYLKDLQPNQVAVIPTNGISPAILGSHISAWCCTEWGKGNSTCMTSPDKQSIQVVRFMVTDDLLNGVEQ